MENGVLVKISELEKTYKVKKVPDVQALKKISFSLPQKGMVFILGKSGCGKSTLLNLLGGLDGFDSGDIKFNEKSIKGFSAREYDNYRNNCVGFVFQENNLLNEYSVKHNVGLALDLKSERNYEEKLNSALKSVDLEDFGDRKCNRLSGGQKQRVAIARAIVKDPEMLLCDEPTGALDSETGEEIFNLFKKISENILVVVVSHDREAAEKYGDRIIELKDGEIIGDSAPQTYKESKTEDSRKTNHGLPFKRFFSYGLRFLTAKPIRLAICTVLCILTFTILGVCDTFANYDRAGAVANSIEEFKTPCFVFTKNMVTKEYGGWSFSQTQYIMGDEDYEAVKCNIKARRLDKVYRLDAYCTYYNYNESANYIEELRNRQIHIFNKENCIQELSDGQTKSDKFKQYCNGLIELNQTFCDDYGFPLLCGKYPKAYDEVVIPLYFYNFFKLDGYFDKQTKSLISIEKYEDILEKTVTLRDFTFKIVGIIDTKVDLNLYGRYIYNDEYVYWFDFASPQLILESGPHNIFYCADGFYRNVFLPLELEKRGAPADAPVYDVAQLIAPDNGSYSARKYNAGLVDRQTLDDDETAYILNTIENHIVDFAVDDFMSFFSFIFRYASWALIVITALFVTYFTSGVIMEKKREIGVLRALGASRTDIFKIFTSENLIFIAAIIAVSTILGVIGGVAVNGIIVKKLGLNMVVVKFGFRQFGIILGLAVSAVLLGCIIPIIHLLRAKPVDIIAGR